MDGRLDGQNREKLWIDRWKDGRMVGWIFRLLEKVRRMGNWLVKIKKMDEWNNKLIRRTKRCGMDRRRDGVKKTVVDGYMDG